MLRISLLASVVVVLSGCPKEPEGTSAPKAAEPAAVKPATPAVVADARAAPPTPPLAAAKTAGESKVVKELAFSDTNGDNKVVFTSTRSPGKSIDGDPTFTEQLNVVHTATKDGKDKVLREVRDQVADCDFDLTAKFVPTAFATTDLDADGIKEVTFAYELGCHGDVSPNTLKLLLLENGEKFIIRGETRIQMGSEVLGGKKEVDASLLNGPKPFQEHALKVWENIVEAKM